MKGKLIVLCISLVACAHVVHKQQTDHQKPGAWVRVDDMNLKRFYNQAPKTYLLSFPGSGNTWLRYCLEYLTKRPTLEMRAEHITKINCPIGYWYDYMQTDYTRAPIWKVHYIDHMKAMGSFNPEQETLIVIVRNPMEALPRIFKVLADRQQGIPIEQRTAYDLVNNSLTLHYFEILKLYDSWNPDKRYMVYYEDLIVNPKETLHGLLDFLHASNDALLQRFIQEFEPHQNASLALYEKEEERSLTRARGVKQHAHLLPESELHKLQRYCKQIAPDLYQQYLKRYEQ